LPDSHEIFWRIASPYDTSEVNMKKDDAEMQRGSGLFIGSEPINGIHDRRALSRDDDDSKDKGDDDATDSDKRDSDATDKGDGVDGSKDADGRD